MSKAVLALFVLGAVAIGLLVMLLIGGREVENDGVENDSAGVPGGPPALAFAVPAATG